MDVESATQRIATSFPCRWASNAALISLSASSCERLPDLNWALQHSQMPDGRQRRLYDANLACVHDLSLAYRQKRRLSLESTGCLNGCLDVQHSF